MIKISLNVNSRLEESLKNRKDICLLETGISLQIDGESVLKPISINDFCIDYVDNFFYYCLWLPRNLYTGKTFKYLFSGPGEATLSFKTIDDNMMELQVHCNGSTSERVKTKKYIVDQKEFVKAVIRDADEFLKLVLSVDQSIGKGVCFKVISRDIEDAKVWLCRLSAACKGINIVPVHRAQNGSEILKTMIEGTIDERCITSFELKDANLDTLEYLISSLSDPHADTRAGAAYALGFTHNEICTAPLVRLLYDENHYVADQAKKSLVNLGCTNAIEPLIEALINKNSLAVTVLYMINDQRVIEPLIKAASDPDSNVRYNAIYVLGGKYDSRIIKPILIACKDVSPNVRSIARDTIMNVQCKSMLDILLNNIDDCDQDMRIAILTAMYNFDVHTVINPLIRFLNDPSPAVRLRAIWVLGHANNNIAIKYIRQAINDPSEEVRKEASRILQLKNPDV